MTLARFDIDRFGSSPMWSPCVVTSRGERACANERSGQGFRRVASEGAEASVSPEDRACRSLRRKVPFGREMSACSMGRA